MWLLQLRLIFMIISNAQAYNTARLSFSLYPTLNCASSSSSSTTRARKCSVVCFAIVLFYFPKILFVSCNTLFIWNIVCLVLDLNSFKLFILWHHSTLMQGVYCNILLRMLQSSIPASALCLLYYLAPNASEVNTGERTAFMSCVQEFYQDSEVHSDFSVTVLLESSVLLALE